MTFDALPIEHTSPAHAASSADELFGELAALGASYGFSHKTVSEFLAGMREALGPIAPECFRELQDPLSRLIVHRKYFLQPLAYLAVLTAAAPARLLVNELRKCDASTWLGVLHRAFGLRRMLRLLVAFGRHHIALAEKDSEYAVYLVRLSGHWQSNPIVTEALNELKTPCGRDERQRNRLLRLLSDPIRPDSPVRDGARGRPHNHCENFYLLERWNHLAGNPLAAMLASECRVLFGVARADRSIHIQLHRLRKKSAVSARSIWVEVPPHFRDTALGKLLATLDPPEISQAPWSRRRLSKNPF